MQPGQVYPPQEPYGAYGPYGAPGSQPYGGQQPYPLDEPEDDSRSPLTTVLIGGIVILLIAITGGAALLISRLHAAAANTVPIVAAAPTATATPTPTPTPTATPTPAFMTYTDPGGSYQLLVPTDWVSQTSQLSTGTGTVFGSSDEMVGFGITRYNAAADQSLFATEEQKSFIYVSTTFGGPGTYSHLQGPTTVSFAGENWVQESADVQVRGGVTLHVVVLLANHNGHLYYITYMAESAVFNNFNTKDFQPMERSFKFLT